MQIDSKASAGSGGKSQPQLLIDWTVFRNTLSEWIMSMPHLVFTLIDQTGYLTQKERVNLHQILMAFFIQTHKDKRLEILNRTH